MKKCWALAVCAAAVVAADVHAAPDVKLTPQQCAEAGVWLDPSSGETLAPDALIKRMAAMKVVLLGESHAVKDHQLWQAHTLAALHARQPNMIVGFEMFPRAVQSALDAWSRGKLAEAAFLRDSKWRQSWGYDAAYYMPIFDFVRHHRITSRAINVDRGLISRVGREGWAAVPEDEREGIGDPAPAVDAYRASLATVFAEKMRQGIGRAGHSASEEGSTPDLDEIKETPAFATFVEAQLTWDRAMAEGLANARADRPGTLAVGIMGRGHAEFGHGVPHQLADLGVDDVAVLLPVERGAACEATPAGMADAVFVVDAPLETAAAPEKPRLGIVIEAGDGGVNVLRVVDDSIAAATGMAVGDTVLSAAGVPVAENEALIEIIQRQAPGTWLPLTVRRDGTELELVAKFPPVPTATP